MNKKVIILIEIIICITAIVIISIFGNIPEMWRDFEYASSLNFTVKNVELLQNETSYQLEWTLGPENATIKAVRFTTDQKHVTVSPEGLVTFSKNQGATIIILTTDGSNLKDSINITFKAPGGGTIPLD